MPSYNLKFNKDDSVIRHIIIGLLADLNDKVYYMTQLSNDERVKIDIPFYYTLAGDDNFIRDHFLFTSEEFKNNYGDKVTNKAIGNYDSIPRAVVQLTSLTIDSGALVNKHSRGKYEKLDGSSLKSFSSEFEMIPVNMSFDVEVLLDSQLSIFKTTEALIKKLYKNNDFNVDVGHLEEGTYRIASFYRLPEDFSQERPVEFTFSDKREYKLTFSIELSTFIPSFKFETEMFAGNRMIQIGSDAKPVLDAENPQVSNINKDSIDYNVILDSSINKVTPESLGKLRGIFSYISNENIIGKVNLSGGINQRENYNGVFAGFVFLDTGNNEIYIKNSNDYGDWVGPFDYLG